VRHGLFSVRDRAAAAFLPPFVLHSDAMAIREFGHAARIPDHKFCLHPQDFSLYKLGHYDDETGLLIAFPEPQFLASAVQMELPLPEGQPLEVVK